VVLEGFGVSCLAEPFDCIRMSQKMGIDPLRDPRSLGKLLEDLPGPVSIYGEKPIVRSEILLVSIGSEFVCQSLRASYKSKFFLYPKPPKQAFLRTLLCSKGSKTKLRISSAPSDIKLELKGRPFPLFLAFSLPLQQEALPLLGSDRGQFGRPFEEPFSLMELRICFES